MYLGVGSFYRGVSAAFNNDRAESRLEENVLPQGAKSSRDRQSEGAKILERDAIPSEI